MQTELQNVIVVPPGGGDAWNVLGTGMSCKISSEQTGGVYAVVESQVPPQAGPPTHIHHNEDEVFYVLEGEFEIRCGDETFVAREGATAVLPKDVPHTFRNIGEGEGKLLTTIIPGGFERFFAEVSEKIQAMPQDIEKLMAIAGKYNVEFVS